MAFLAAAPIWAVVPVKPFGEGKSRLMLPNDERIALNREFLAHVLRVVRSVILPLNVVVVSRDERVLIEARKAGVRGLLERSAGELNLALAEGARFAADRGAGAILSVATDLPRLCGADLDAMIDAFTTHDLVLAPDTAGIGTNAMLMAPGLIPYRHGTSSLWQHLAAAREQNLQFKLVQREGLMHDIDHAAQWQAHRACAA